MTGLAKRHGPRGLPGTPPIEPSAAFHRYGEIHFRRDVTGLTAGTSTTDVTKTEPVPSPQTRRAPVRGLLVHMGADDLPICDGDVPESVSDVPDPEED